MNWRDPNSSVRRRTRHVLWATASPVLAAGGVAALRVIGLLGSAANAAGLSSPNPSELQALFPSMSSEAARTTARRVAALRAMNHALIGRVLDKGPAAVLDFFHPRMNAPPSIIANRSGGLVLGGFHIGAHYGMGAALQHWKVPSLALPYERIHTPEARTTALQAAVKILKSGGIVVAALDGPLGANARPVTILRRSIDLRRGPFAAARLARVPLIPYVARFVEGGRIVLELGSPISSSCAAPEEFESEVAAKAAAWMESHLVVHPEDLWPYTLRHLLQSPRTQSSELQTQNS